MCLIENILHLALFFSRVLEPMFESGAENQPKAEKQKHATKPLKRESTNKPTFLHIHIKAIMQGITIGASLLPSLKAQYKVKEIGTTWRCNC